MITQAEIGWLAGLLEGEGCFTIGTSASLHLQMTDLDTVCRAAKMMRSGVGGPSSTGREGHKPMYYTAIHGARAAAWMMTLWPLMGKRRRKRMLECLRFWRSHRVDNRDKEFCKRGHPLSGDNVRRTPQRHGSPLLQRVCRTCQKEHQRKYHERKAATSTI